MGIKTLRGNEELLAEINTTRLQTGEVALWWIGQAGFVLKMKDTVVYIDPYLSDYAKKNKKIDHARLMDIPIAPELINNASLVICTHDHIDHLDPETIPVIAQNSPQAFFAGPRSTQERFRELGVVSDRFIGTEVNVQANVKDLAIYPLPAKHEEFDYDRKWGYPYQSYIISAQGIVIYHAGDTIPYEGIENTLKAFNIDIALVPVNGRDEERHQLGFKGNFTCEEACLLAKAIKPKLLIPAHYDMFALNTVDIAHFIDSLKRLIPEQEYRVLQCAEKLIVKYEVRERDFIREKIYGKRKNRQS